MKIAPFFFLPLLLFSSIIQYASAQNAEIGLSTGINVTYFRESASDMDNSSFFSRPSPGFYFNVPVYLDLPGKIDLKTGPGFQFRRFLIEQNQFNDPAIGGKIRVASGYLVGEIPVLASYRPTFRKNRLEILAGAVFSYNSLQSTMISTSGGPSPQPATISVQSGPFRQVNTYSADLYLGIGICKFKKKKLNQQFTLACQYGLNPLSRMSLTTNATSSLSTDINTIVLQPLLTSFVLSYSYFPGRMKFELPFSWNSGPESESED